MAHLLEVLYLKKNPNKKARMVEIEEFARWLVEMTSEVIIALEDGKIQLSEYPSLANSLWKSKEALMGIKKFDDEWAQATEEDFISLKQAVVSSIKTDKIPAWYIDILGNATIENFKLFRATRTLLKGGTETI